MIFSFIFQKAFKGLQKAEKEITFFTLSNLHCVANVETLFLKVTLLNIICKSLVAFCKVLKKFYYKNIYDNSPKDSKNNNCVCYR